LIRAGSESGMITLARGILK